MKAFIIEDDIGASVEYEQILSECGIENVSVFSDYAEAKQNIAIENPDITILDVFLKEQSSLDLIPALKEKNCDIIIVTGYPKDDLRQVAVEFDVINFLPKPVNLYTLKFQIQVIAKRRSAEMHESFCFVKSKNNYKRIAYHDIMFLETEGNYTSIYTANDKYILKKSLKNVSAELPPKIFTRVHRNFMINNNHIKSLDLKNNKIEMHHEKTILVGGKYRNDIKKALGENFKVI